MKLSSQDIYINNGNIWLSQNAVIAICNISEVYLGKVRSLYKKEVYDSWNGRDILPDMGKSWRWAKIGGSFFYAYNNIPDRHPNNYRSLFPKPEELAVLSIAKPEQEDTFEKQFTAALKEDYRKNLHLYNDCTKAQQENISKYAAILTTAVEYIQLQNVNTSKDAFFVRLAAWVKNNMVPYAPLNHRILKQKVLEAMNTADISVIAKLPRTGNNNAAKDFLDDEIRSWVLQMKYTGRNYTDAFIIRKIQQMCMLTNKPVPSKRWVGMNMTEQHNLRYLTAEKNYGTGSRFGKQYSGYQRFQNALFAGDCWQVDGTRVNLLPHKTTHQDKDGNTKNSLAYLYIVAVRDVHSGDILGYTYTYNENRWEVHEALKMAVKTAGYLPYEIVFDKFPGHNTPEAKTYLQELEQMGVTITMSSSKTVKQNLERWFGTMQSVFLQESKYYYGEGIKSTRKSAHRSEEYMSNAAKEANAEKFDWNAACSHYDAIIEAYRNTPYKEWSKEHSHIDASPRELHELSEKPDVRILEEQDYYFLFGLKKVFKFKGQGLIEIIIRHVRFAYRCTDYNIVSNYPEVLVSYDPDDLSHIHLYKPSDNIIKQYLCRVEEEKQAQRYGSNADWGVVATNTAKIKKLEMQQQQELQQKMAVGSDIVAMLNPMSVSKAAKEENESIYLNERFGIQMPKDEGNDIDINIAHSY